MHIVCVYIYMHITITHTHTYTDTHTHLIIQTHMYIYICFYILILHMYTYMRILACLHADRVAARRMIGGETLPFILGAPMGSHLFQEILSGPSHHWFSVLASPQMLLGLGEAITPTKKHGPYSMGAPNHENSSLHGRISASNQASDSL